MGNWTLLDVGAALKALIGIKLRTGATLPACRSIRGFRE